MRLGRKTSVSQLQDATEPAETCDARYPGREDVYHELDCAGALRELLQKETALLRVQLGPTVAARRVGNVFHDRGFADVFLRYLMQTRGRMHMTMNVLQCDIQLQGCQLGHMLREDDVARGGGHRPQWRGSPHCTTAFGQRTASTC